MHISYSQYDMLLMSISVSSYMFICQLSHSLSSLKINRFVSQNTYVLLESSSHSLEITELTLLELIQITLWTQNTQ